MNGTAFRGIAAGLQGWMQGMSIAEQQKRQQEQDAWTKEQRDWARGDRAKQDQYEASMKDAAAPVAAKEQTMVDNGDPTAAAPQAYTVGKQTFGTKEDADAEAAAQNAPAARWQRMADAAGTAGKGDQMQAYLALAQKARDEGAEHFIQGVNQLAPTLDKVKDGPIRIDTPDALTSVYDSTGSHRVGKGTQIEFYQGAYADGTPYVDARLMSKEGKPIVQSMRAYEGLMLMTPKERATLAADDRKEAATKSYREGVVANDKARTDEAIRHNQTMEGLTTAQNQRLAASSAASSQLARDQFEFNKKMAGPASGPDYGGIDKLVEGFAKGGDSAAPPSADQVEGYRTKLIQSRNKQYALGVVQRNLAQLDPSTPEYAEAYKKGLAAVGGDAAALNAVARAPGGKQPPAPAPAAPAPAAPAPAPSGPGFMSRMVERASAAVAPVASRVSELGVDYSTPEGKQQLAARVTEAARGGRPLTDVEAMRAKQLGITQ